VTVAGPDRAPRRDQVRRRRTNLALAVLLPAGVVTGVAANTIGTDQPVDLIAVHGAVAAGILLLAPWKSAVVRAGWARGRPAAGWSRSRRWSAALLVLVAATLLSGLGHATGLLDRVPLPAGLRLTVMQVHVGAGLVALAVLVLHVRRHPVRPKPVDLGRRALVGAAGLAALSTVTWAGYEQALVLAGLPGGGRRFTGSVEHSSGDPQGLPVVSWIDDRTPVTDPERWRMLLLGRRVDLAGLTDLVARSAEPVEAVLDCTGGWFSRQSWSGVRLDRLLAGEPALPAGTRSIEVVSSTGFSRRFPVDGLDRVWLVTAVGGRPLPAGHGHPARIVAPDRRGFWWVKWVVEIRADARPWWTQPPFPLT
jgi:hypothetical protein